jgi:hypothetical protein
VGPKPLQWLFQRTAQDWSEESARRHPWRGLALFGLDGTTARVADTPENRTHFGSQSAGQRGVSGYPLLRAVTLSTLRTHLLRGLAFGPYGDERPYALTLLGLVPDYSLLAVDRNFLWAAFLLGLRQSGTERHWLTRARSNTTYEVLKQLGQDDALVELTVSDKAREEDPSLPKTYLARAIGYRRKGFRPQVLLTSLLDAEKYPAKEVVSLYHERWEVELGYDEIKTEMLEREESLRSKSPPMVEQEVWGLVLAYNLVRLEMEQVAEEAGVEPRRISFRASLRRIQDEWLWCANTTPGNIPKYLKALREDLKHFILPPRRERSSYPRAVKLNMSNYARKRPVAPKPTLK